VSDNPILTPSTITYCPLCGATLAVEAVPPDHREQKVCSRCRFVFYLNPKVVAATIPEQDGAILLTRRSINPGKGLWTFPGGFVDFGETVTDGAMRETFEETGLKVDLSGLLNVYTYPGAPVIIVHARSASRVGRRARVDALGLDADQPALFFIARARNLSMSGTTNRSCRPSAIFSFSSHASTENR